MISGKAQNLCNSRTINTTRSPLSNISNVRNSEISNTTHKNCSTKQHLTGLSETTCTLNFDDVTCTEKVIEYEHIGMFFVYNIT